MGELLIRIFGESAFMPHGHCYLWQPGMLWLQVLSNASIGAAYLCITLTLLALVRRVRDIPFQWVYVAFAIFIVSCGLTHFSDVLVIWHPLYWLDGGLRALTAVASVGTAVLLQPLVPRVIALAETAALAHDRGVKLEQANRELAVLLDRSTELERLKTRFFANVSHELRTPLTLILGPTERLLAGPLTEAQRRELAVIDRNARVLLDHVNDLLDISKLEAGKMRPEYRDADLARLVRHVASQFDILAEERGVRFTVLAPPALPAQVDPDKLQRAVSNLLSNAFKFTPPGGQVRCELQGVDGLAVLEVADSGPGIPPADREVVFERFHQLEGGTTRRLGGTGLGLAIVRDFVTLLGGDVAVFDAPEGGAMLRLRVPLRAPAGAPVGDAGEPLAAVASLGRTTVEVLRDRPAPQSARGAPGRPRVLVVEDNPEMRRFIVDSLADEYELTAAADGQQALELAEAEPPDLVLTDMMMPRLSGESLVLALRARPALADIPIVLVTAKSDDALRVRLLRGGAQDYVMKPFSLEELRARVGNLVTMKRTRDVLQRELDTHLTDLEPLAAELSQRRRELSTAIDALQTARAQAEAASRAKTQFLGLVSHELRSPLTALQLQLELLRRDRSGALSDRHTAIVERMNRATTRLIELVDTLLHFARLQSGRMDLQLGDVDLDAIADEVVHELHPAAQQKGLTLTATRAGGPHAAVRALRSDPRLVRLVLVNLVTNAIKFTREGSVQVEIAAEEEHHLLTVRDTGPGIAPEDRVRIFQPFEQVESVAQKHTPGVGLGLTLVREMVAALAGTIELRSEVGRGTTFVVRLPDAPPET